MKYSLPHPLQESRLNQWRKGVIGEGKSAYFVLEVDCLFGWDWVGTSEVERKRALLLFG